MKESRWDRNTRKLREMAEAATRYRKAKEAKERRIQARIDADRARQYLIWQEQE